MTILCLPKYVFCIYTSKLILSVIQRLKNDSANKYAKTIYNIQYLTKNVRRNASAPSF